MTIAVDTTLADSAEHDVLIGIGDGTRFAGFHIVGKNNYHAYHHTTSQRGRQY